MKPIGNFKNCFYEKNSNEAIDLEQDLSNVYVFNVYSFYRVKSQVLDTIDINTGIKLILPENIAAEIHPVDELINKSIFTIPKIVYGNKDLIINIINLNGAYQFQALNQGKITVFNQAFSMTPTDYLINPKTIIAKLTLKKLSID